VNRKLLPSLLIGLLLVSIIPFPGAATSGSQSSVDYCIRHGEEDAFSVPQGGETVVTVNRTSNASVVRYTFQGYSSDPQYLVHLPRGLTVVNSSGFDILDREATRNYNADRPWIEVTLGNVVDNVSYTTAQSNIVVPALEGENVDLYYDPQPTGFAGSQYVLLGEYSTAMAQEGCQHVRVVVPESVDLDRKPIRYAETVTTAGNSLSIGPKYRVVTAFVAPSEMGNRNGFTPPRSHDEAVGAAEFYIGPTAKIETPRNTWIHEYVHTRQTSYYPRWMSEGSAVYFTAQISLENGWITPRQYDRYFAKEARANGTPDTPNLKNPEYIHGAFFFMQMEDDLEGANTSVEGIYRELNAKGYDSDSSMHVWDFEEEINSTKNTSVTYADPMLEPVAVSYIVLPEWWPHFFRQNDIILPFFVSLTGVMILSIIIDPLRKLLRFVKVSWGLSLY